VRGDNKTSMTKTAHAKAWAVLFFNSCNTQNEGILITIREAKQIATE
jgi:hypothetical protein